uniref:Uncharacterized protein n=1 Tax=Cannabis sativa TaxID=3483 RepID=A0A803QRK8_CANSA
GQDLGRDLNPTYSDPSRVLVEVQVRIQSYLGFEGHLSLDHRLESVLVLMQGLESVFGFGSYGRFGSVVGVPGPDKLKIYSSSGLRILCQNLDLGLTGQITVRGPRSILRVWVGIEAWESFVDLNGLVLNEESVPDLDSQSIPAQILESMSNLDRTSSLSQDRGFGCGFKLRVLSRLGPKVPVLIRRVLIRFKMQSFDYDHSAVWSTVLECGLEFGQSPV